ncbi:hypothetical protein NM688_g8339 [Phlebia brevispora]|uniref:Uncharacterized protein n=1 Tax=Phlebia brevispora TaxID=194682 RepID=A0ACC1RT63_9APHY|nr:hypothetical protein NM688_g8339 [Phlebia brevispora]
MFTSRTLSFRSTIPQVSARRAAIALRCSSQSERHRSSGPIRTTLPKRYQSTQAGVGAAVAAAESKQEPSDTWKKVQKYTSQLEDKAGEGRLEYVSADVTDQARMWKVGEEIGDKEGRMDVCIASAGIALPEVDCLEYPADKFQQVVSVNLNGVLYTAQAAGRQMARFDKGGSIILIGSIAGSVALQGMAQISYSASKGAVLQMARTMACELAPRGIRVNSISPGWVRTGMTGEMIDAAPDFFNGIIPMGRVANTRELRGAAAWLASDASSFCTGSESDMQYAEERCRPVNFPLKTEQLEDLQHDVIKIRYNWAIGLRYFAVFAGLARDKGGTHFGRLVVADLGCEVVADVALPEFVRDLRKWVDMAPLTNNGTSLLIISCTTLLKLALFAKLTRYFRLKVRETWELSSIRTASASAGGALSSSSSSSCFERDLRARLALPFA